MGIFKAGVASIPISPGPGVPLGGYPHVRRENTGIHDELYAGCIFLDDGRMQAAVVSLDVLDLSRRHVRTIRSGAAQITGIPEDHILVCCIHSHSAPSCGDHVDLDNLLSQEPGDQAYANFVVDQAIEAVSAAKRSAFSAQVAVGKGICGREKGVGGNRRDPEGPADPEVWVLAVRDGEGRVRGCMTEYALHPTFLHAENLLVSADYCGYVRTTVEGGLPGAVHLFAQGFSGNQSSRYFRSGQTFPEAERAGNAVGTESLRVVNGLEWNPDATLDIRSALVDPLLKTIPDAGTAKKDAEKARAEYARIRESDAPYIEKRNAELSMFGAENTYGFAQMLASGTPIALMENNFPAEVQMIRIGDAYLLGFQGEIFVDYALELKRRASGRKIITVELANGQAMGYTTTPEAVAEGGYETGTSMMMPDNGELYIQEAMKLIGEAEEELCNEQI